jgi:hypothetical protein
MGQPTYVYLLTVIIAYLMVWMRVLTWIRNLFFEMPNRGLGSSQQHEAVVGSNVEHAGEENMRGVRYRGLSQAGK